MAGGVEQLVRTREDELLFCCARVAPAADVWERVVALAGEPLDWDMVVRRSWWHRIRPLTYRHLKKLPPGVVPRESLMELAGYAAELAQRSHRLHAALQDVAGIFESESLRALVFKGPTLTEDAYGDLELRECGDLDLLISLDEFPRIRRLLTDHGFRSWWERDDRNRQVFACEFEREDATLDVHWHLAPQWLNYRIDFDQLWSSGVPLLNDGQTFRKPCAEDGVSLLSIHGTKHFWERLRWICDIAELLNSGRITDWERVEAGAIRSNSLRSVQLGLWLAYDLLDARLPADVREKLAAQSDIRYLGQQVSTWLGHGERTKASRRLLDRFRFRMKVCERMRDRVPQVMHYLFARSSQQGD